LVIAEITHGPRKPKARKPAPFEGEGKKPQQIWDNYNAKRRD
jgi:hypothetical protein